MWKCWVAAKRGATATTDVAAFVLFWHKYSRSFALACFILDRDMENFFFYSFLFRRRRDAICNGNLLDYIRRVQNVSTRQRWLGLLAQNWVSVRHTILTRCKLIGRFDGGGGSMNVCFVLISSGFNSSNISNSTSLPFVSPRSYHSTVTDRCCGFIFDTIAEWTRPKICVWKMYELREL